MDALDRDGEAHCARCNETVVDLGRGHVAAGRVVRCARILVAATALAGCAPREATAPSAAPSVVVPAAPPLDADGYTFADDPLQLGSRYAVGAVEVSKADDGIATMDPGR